MQTLLKNVKIEINDKLFLKDPESSALGKRIIEHSILLIDAIGFEQFTFKKLGSKIASNESSVYRYFENKHKLLLYLASWYWGWIELKLVISTTSITHPVKRLESAIQIVTETIKEDTAIGHINEVLLSEIVVNEFSKSYLTKEVDDENKEGYFTEYKRLITRLAQMIIEVDSNYPHPNSLASTILEGALHQHFLRKHFPKLTDCTNKVTPSEFFKNLAFASLQLKQPK